MNIIASQKDTINEVNARRVCLMIEKEDEGALAFFLKCAAENRIGSWGELLRAAASSGSVKIWDEVFDRLPIRERYHLGGATDLAILAIQSGSIPMLRRVLHDVRYEFDGDWSRLVHAAAVKGDFPLWKEVLKMSWDGQNGLRYFDDVLEAAVKHRPIWMDLCKLAESDFSPFRKVSSWDDIARAAAIGGESSTLEEVLKMADGKVTKSAYAG